MPSFRSARECFCCPCPELICHVFVCFLRYDFWQQQLETSHGQWKGRVSVWEKEKKKKKSSNRKYSDASVCTGRWWKTSWCVCVCFPGHKGATIELCGGFNCLELYLHSTNLETRGVCARVCVSETLKPLFRTLNNLPAAAKPPPAAPFCLCTQYFLHQSEFQQPPSNAHYAKHRFTVTICWKSCFIFVERVRCPSKSQLCIVS